MIHGETTSHFEPITFEAVKIGQSLGERGLLLKLGVEHWETPPELPATPQGSRFLVVLVPLPSKEEELGASAVQQAGIICKEPSFWRFLQLFGYSNSNVTSEEVAAEVLRTYLGVRSRSEIRTDGEKRDLFIDLNKFYHHWMMNDDKHGKETASR